MTRESLKRLLSSYSCILLPDKKIQDIENALKENNLTYDNLTTVFVYNRENSIDLSLFTSPDKHIKLVYEKTK